MHSAPMMLGITAKIGYDQLWLDGLAGELRCEIKARPAYVQAQALQLFDVICENLRLPRTKALEGKPGFYRIRLASGELSIK